MPRVEAQEIDTVKATVVGANEAIQLRALKEMKDAKGVLRRAGEEYLMRDPGAYLPEVHEEIVKITKAVVLTEKKALHLRASRAYTDKFGKARKAGEEWLLTIKNCDTHIPDVYEEVVNTVTVTTLTSRQVPFFWKVSFFSYESLVLLFLSIVSSSTLGTPLASRNLELASCGRASALSS